MSDNQQIYIGAYLTVITLPYNISDAVKECPEHGDLHICTMKEFSFCPICGKRMVEVFHGTEKYYHMSNLIQTDNLIEIPNTGLGDNVITLASNMNDKTNKTFSGGEEGVYALDKPDDYIYHFAKINDMLIWQLNQHELVNSVTCRYGAISYYLF